MQGHDEECQAMKQDYRERNRRGEGRRLRADIVSAARTLLEQDGTEAAVTLRGVAREIGVTAPALYAHFADRQQLVEAVVGSAWADMSAAVSEALDALPASTTPFARLQVRCRVYIAYAHQHPATYQILFSRHHPSRVPDVGSTAAVVFEQFRREVAAAGPRLEPGDTYPTSVLIWAGLHGLAGLPPHHPRFDWPDLDDLVDRLLLAHLPQQPGR